MTPLLKHTMTDDGTWIVVPFLLTRTPAGLSDARADKLAEEYRALVRLAWTQHKIAWQNRRWATECEAAADLEGYRKHRKEANKLWRDAHWHLRRARDRKDLIDG